MHPIGSHLCISSSSGQGCPPYSSLKRTFFLLFLILSSQRHGELQLPHSPSWQSTGIELSFRADTPLAPTTHQAVDRITWYWRSWTGNIKKQFRYLLTFCPSSRCYCHIWDLATYKIIQYPVNESNIQNVQCVQCQCSILFKETLGCFCCNHSGTPLHHHSVIDT